MLPSLEEGREEPAREGCGRFSIVPPFSHWIDRFLNGARRWAELKGWAV
jgi:hypothetical protein